MPGKGRGKPKSKYGKKRLYKRKGYRKPKGVADIAGVSETFERTGLNTGLMYEKRDFTLSGSPRATAVATAYQHYKIKKITITFKPQIDTFAGGGAFTVPNLFFMIDKSGSIPTNATIAGLKSMGAKPQRFDDKNISISWRPSVLTSTATSPGANGQTQYKVSPWLSTNNNALQPGIFVPSSVDHLGMFWYVETAGAAMSYTVEYTIHYVFKKPLNTTIVGETEAIKV